MDEELAHRMVIKDVNRLSGQDSFNNSIFQ